MSVPVPEPHSHRFPGRHLHWHLTRRRPLLLGAPLIPILFLSQALNAILLLVLLPFMRSLGRDRELMGSHALGRGDRLVTGVALAVIAVSVLALGVLTVF